MAYEELIRKAKEYLAPESGEFESYYRKAAENLRADYNSSLAELKKQYGVDVDKRKIELDGDIKAFGTYRCEVKLYTGISAKVYVVVTEA